MFIDPYINYFRRGWSTRGTSEIIVKMELGAEISSLKSLRYINNFLPKNISENLVEEKNLLK